MRCLTLLALLGLCTAPHSDGAAPEETPADQAARQAQREQQANLTIARNLDINYRKCAVVILTDQIRQLGHFDRLSVYVSIIGEDADQATLDALRSLAPSVLPGSQMPQLAPGETASDHWHYSVSSIHRDSDDGYTAIVGFYCGSLCGARIEYQLKKHEDSCAVAGQRVLVQI